MKRKVRIALMVTGLLIALYGALNHYELVTVIGAFLYVIGLMLPVLINFNKG